MMLKISVQIQPNSPFKFYWIGFPVTFIVCFFFSKKNSKKNILKKILSMKTVEESMLVFMIKTTANKKIILFQSLPLL
jgi:hypothetical protein